MLARKLMKLLPQFLYERIRARERRMRSAAARLDAFIAVLNRQYADVPVRVLDVGARLGLGDFGYGRLKSLAGLELDGIEPDPAEARRLETTAGVGRYRRVYPVAVADRPGSAVLHVTRLKGCSSIREPLVDATRGYESSRWFEKVGETEVELTTLDLLFPERTFDFVKVDVQGVEYEVLQGGLGVASRATGLTVELQFTACYRGQRLFPEVHRLITDLGFQLIMLHGESEIFGGQVVEANCAYVRRSAELRTRDDLLRGLLFALMAGNVRYFATLLREHGPSLMSAIEVAGLARHVNVVLREEKLALLGPHN
jgi:FkbM family methyltransferase